MTDESKLRAILAAIAQPDGQLGEHAAWQSIAARIVEGSSSATRRRRARTGIAALVVVAAAAAFVLATSDDDRKGLGVAATGATGPGATAATARPPMVLARGHWDGALELHDSSGALVRVLTTAGAGRPADMPEGYGLRDISASAGAVWFTETEGPEERPSIWRFDLAASQRELVVRDAFAPAVTPDGGRLAYVASRFLGGGVEQSIVISDLRSGDEQVVRSYATGADHVGPTRLTHLEWSPDGARLLFRDAYEQQRVGVIDPAADRSLSDATFLPGEQEVATWLDDTTILSRAPCCVAGATSSGLVVSDADSGEVLRHLRVVTDGMSLSDLAAGPGGWFLMVTTEGALYEVSPDDTVRLVSREVGAVDW